jgi:hypothetical protein
MSKDETPIREQLPSELVLSPIEQLRHLVDALCEGPLPEKLALRVEVPTSYAHEMLGNKVLATEDLNSDVSSFQEMVAQLSTRYTLAQACKALKDAVENRAKRTDTRNPKM